MWTKRCIFPYWKKLVITYSSSAPVLREKRICKYDASILRYCQGRPLQYAVRWIVDTTTPHPAEKCFPDNLPRLLNHRCRHGKSGREINEYCCIVMDSFIRTYKDFYRKDFYNEVLATSNAGTKMKLVNNEAHKLAIPYF